MWKENNCFRNSPIPNIYSAEIHVKFCIFCILNILKHVFNMYLNIFFSLVDFSISLTPQKRSRYKNVDITENKTVSIVFKGVRGHQIINRAEYSSSKHAFEQCFVSIVLSFCWMTLWPVGFNDKHLATFVKKLVWGKTIIL